MGKVCHNGEGAQEQLQKMSLDSAMINSKPTLSQDAGEHRILYGTSGYCHLRGRRKSADINK